MNDIISSDILNIITHSDLFLGVGFDSSTYYLLLLIWTFLITDPQKRMSSKEALNHAYFHEDNYQ